MPMPRRRPDLPTGVEEPVPYDQTGLMGQDMPPEAGAPPAAVGPPADPSMDPGQAPMDLGSMGQPAPMDLGGLGQDPNAPLNDMAPPDQMGGLAPQSPEDAQVEQMAAALQDPNIDPATKAQIEQQLSLAARRQLAGLGG